MNRKIPDTANSVDQSGEVLVSALDRTSLARGPVTELIAANAKNVAQTGLSLAGGISPRENSTIKAVDTVEVCLFKELGPVLDLESDEDLAF